MPILDEKVLIDYADEITYIGKAPCGSSEKSPAWKITKVVHDAAGKVIGVYHSGGVQDQVFAWSDRADLEYK